jgi:hypothetical protein
MEVMMIRVSDKFSTSDWEKKDDKSKKKTDADFISCEEKDSTERSKFDEYIKLYGNKRVEDCCRKIKAPRSREDYERCLKGN